MLAYSEFRPQVLLIRWMDVPMGKAPEYEFFEIFAGKQAVTRVM